MRIKEYFYVALGEIWEESWINFMQVIDHISKYASIMLLIFHLWIINE